ncbi:MAG: AMP-binding protein, partial [Actinomycetes bacterium]
DRLGVASADSERVLVAGTESASALLESFQGASASDVVDETITPATLGYLLFTSGTSGAPKAVQCSQGRLAMISTIVKDMFELTPQDVCYAAMPMFHSNALMAGWGPSLAAGAAVAIPTSRRFSASNFLPDVRRFQVTYFNYVGKPLAYILATPEKPDDAENTLRLCFGNEAAADDVTTFAERFGCRVSEAYGSSEGGATVQRTPDTPPNALGRSGEGTVVIDAETGEECPPARFDEAGKILNADECIGELVSKTGGASFEGYWHNDEAMESRLRQGWYWTGDLAYRDDQGFFYFAGRDHDWLRVDGENFASAPVERILTRYPGVILAAVYAVPDEHVGDQVMAALEISEHAAAFDPDDFARFLAEQGDLGTKWAPRYVRISTSLPKTATSKVVKKSLRTERWNSADPTWWRSGRDLAYRPISTEDRAVLDEAVANRVL